MKTTGISSNNVLSIKVLNIFIIICMTFKNHVTEDVLCFENSCAVCYSLNLFNYFVLSYISLHSFAVMVSLNS